MFVYRIKHNSHSFPALDGPSVVTLKKSCSADVAISEHVIKDTPLAPCDRRDPNRRMLPSVWTEIRVSADVSGPTHNPQRIWVHQPCKPCCWRFQAQLQRAASLDGDVPPTCRRSVFIDTADPGFWFEHDVRSLATSWRLNKHQ